MGLAIGIGNGILFTSQRGVSSIIPGLIDDLCARATYCENKTCTTAILEEIAAVRYTPPSPPPPETRFVISVKTDNIGTSNDNQFTIPISSDGVSVPFNYDIKTSDGQIILGNTGNTTITFPSAGTYDIFISGSFPYMFFNNGGDKLKLLDIKNFGIYGLNSSNQISAFYGCVNMVISANDTGNFGGCLSLKQTFRKCTNITSIPLIDTSLCTNFFSSWRECSNLISIPLLNFSNSTTFQSAWQKCFDLTTFPANYFDTITTNKFTLAFAQTNLTTQSIDNILVSIDTSGTINGTFTQSGGQAPSSTGIAAKDSLVTKGWTITYTS